MIVRIETSDGEVHVFKSTDPLEELTHYRYDKELHALLVEAGEAQFCFPLEHIISSKIVKKEM